MSSIVHTKQSSTPANPSAGKVRLFVNSTGSLASVDESGTVKVYAEGITQEQVEDIVGNLIQSGTTITTTYNDASNVLSFEIATATLATINSALQAGANISLLTNNAGYITSAGAPVQSVNGQTGAVSITPANISAQPVDTDLTAIANLSTTGFISRTALGTATTRTITGSTNITVGNGDGLSGNPSIDLTTVALNKLNNALQPGSNISVLTNDANYITSAGAPVQSVNGLIGAVSLTPAIIGAQPVDGDLTAIAGLTTNGIMVRTATNTATTRSITGGTGITVSNGDGVAANPTVAMAPSGVTNGTYGSATQIGTFTVDSTGRLTAAANTSIAIPSTQVTDFAEAVDDRVAALVVAGTGISATYNDPANTLTFVNTDTGSAAVATHVAAGDPHPQYLTSAEGNAAYQPLDGDLTSIASLAGTGLIVRTATNAATTRTVTSGTGISITNGDGVSGNPTITNSDTGSSAVSTHVGLTNPHTQYSQLAAANAFSALNTFQGNAIIGAPGGQANLSSWQSDTAFWIDLPTTGASGIGTGGPGNQAWIAYAFGAGNWFTDAASGDVCYRNTAGNILFGTSAGNYQMRLSSAGVTLKNPLNMSTNDITNALTDLVTTNSTPVATTDSIATAIGKLQAQQNVWTELVTTATVTNNSNTTVTNVTALGFSVVAGGKYRIEAQMVFQSAAGGTGIGFTFNSPNGATGTIAGSVTTPLAGDGTGALYSGAITSLGDLVLATGVPAANTNYLATINAVFIATASGTIVPQIRSETNGTQVTLGIGSNILVRDFG